MSTFTHPSPHSMKMDAVDMVDNPGTSRAARNSDHEERAQGRRREISQRAPSRTPEQAKVERRLLLKADLLILPVCFVAYLLDFLDRSDLGNAAVAGITKDLQMSAQQLSVAASMFYVTYIIFQLPGNLSLKILRPQVQLALALMIWGLFNTLICVAPNYATVVGLRLGVGFGEAFFQAMPLYISLWYKRQEYSKRAAYIFSASAIAGALNGLLAYAVEENLDGRAGLASWRWLFIIEGCLPIGWGFVVLLVLPASPEKARSFFSDQEKHLAAQRTREAFNEPHATINWKSIPKVFRGWNLYLFAIVFSCSNVSLAAFSTFLPVILRTLGHSRLDSQLLTVPVYVVGAISTVAMAVLSDYYQRRGYFMLVAFALLFAGWLMLLVSSSSTLSYASAFVVSAGAYPSTVLALSWILNNQAGFSRRAGTYAIVSMVGQSFSIAATELYSDPPKFYRGNAFAMGSSVVGFLTCLILIFKLQRANQQKRALADSHVSDSLRAKSYEELGSEHPDFYFYC